MPDMRTVRITPGCARFLLGILQAEITRQQQLARRAMELPEAALLIEDYEHRFQELSQALVQQESRPAATEWRWGSNPPPPIGSKPPPPPRDPRGRK